MNILLMPCLIFSLSFKDTRNSTYMCDQWNWGGLIWLFTHLKYLLKVSTSATLCWKKISNGNKSTELRIQYRWQYIENLLWAAPHIGRLNIDLAWRHRRMGPVLFRGAEVSCPNIFSIACPKIKWFCPNITWENGYLKNSRSPQPPPPRGLVRLCLESVNYKP